MNRRMALVAGLGLGFGLAPAMGQPNATVPSEAVRYEGHRVVRMDVASPADVAAMEALGAEFLGCEAHAGPAEFRVPPEAMGRLNGSGRAFQVVVENLQAEVDAESARIRAGRAVRGDWFADYKDLQEVSDYVDALVALRPDLAQRISLGVSLEGREIFGLRVTGAGTGGPCRPELLVNSAQHAREWITPMTTMFLADALVRRYDTDPYIRDLVDRVAFLIVPVVNPDGYDYTWTTARFWRKNRRGDAAQVWGVDLNRNWGHQWGLNIGSSGNPFSETYRGTAPFSEPETQVMRDFVLAHPAIRSHNDVHSSGQLILFPWGYTKELTPDHATFEVIGDEMHDRILAVHGRDYRPGPTFTNIYPVSGGSKDWFYGERGVLSFSYEMRGPGFNPPPGNIIPAGEETLPATLYQAEWIADHSVFISDWNGDCSITVADFLAFLSDWSAGAPRADLNGDGAVNVADFLVFLDAYATGQ